MITGAYNGTQGSVNTETSRNRITPNLQTVLSYLEVNGFYGCTWKDIARGCDLHHGQASGALSNLHKLGLVFTVAGKRRERCQIYFHKDFIGQFEPLLVHHEPVTTKAGRTVKAGEQLANTVQSFLDDFYSVNPSAETHTLSEWYEILSVALVRYKKEVE